jgi:hypothetical protein
MPDETTPPNPMDVWRQFITDSERQWNAFFKEVLGTDTMASGLNTYMEASLTIQRMVADQLERLYESFNIPTHNDLVALGARMKGIEDSLARIEAGGGGNARAPRKRKASTRARPPRTKQPAGAVPSRNGSATT